MRGNRFHRTTLLAAVSLLALTACQKEGAKNDKAATPASLTRETPVSGELTTSSPMNLNDGSRYAEVPVRLAAGQTTRIALEGALQGKLTLFQKDQLIAASRPLCCSAGGGSSYVVVRSDADGDYRLGVSGMNSNSYGPFRVTASALDARNDGALAATETVAGWLNGVATGGNVYDVTVAQAGPYEFTLRSTEFDAHLALTGRAFAVENDDGAGNTDARLTVFLEPGSYQLKASAVEGQGTGMYTLSSTTPQAPAGASFQNSGALALDTTVAGLLMRDEMVYEIQLGERRRVIVSMQSEQLDSHLSLQGSGVRLENDDSGNNRDARIDTALDPGTYRIVARAVDESTGMFTLSTQTLDAPPAGGGDITVGHAGEALLMTGGHDVYRLTVERAGRYVIYLGSNQFDALLNIEGNGVEQMDDDGGNNYDSRLELNLAPGVYTVTVAAADEQGGPYRLTVQ